MFICRHETPGRVAPSSKHGLLMLAMLITILLLLLYYRSLYLELLSGRYV